jgi:hypothetical protein
MSAERFFMFARLADDVDDATALAEAPEFWADACARAGAEPIEAPTFDVVQERPGVPGEPMRGIVGKAMAIRTPA